MSLGILPSSVRLTWPSQRSHLWLSKAKTQGTPDCARTSLFGTRSCQVMPKMLLRQQTWRCWVCALGGSRGSRSRYHTAGWWARRPGTTSSWCWRPTWRCPRPSRARASAAAALRVRFSVQCLGRVCCRCWSLQSWTKVLGTVLQYSYFSVISRFPIKTVHPFGNFLAVLPPPTLYKVKTRKKFWIHASNVVCGVRGGVGPVWIGKRPTNAKVFEDFCPWL